MQLLLRIFADSFIIWARNFSLVYVILLAFLLIRFITPQNIASGTEMQLFLLTVSMLLIIAAFLAGWFNMIAAACRRYFERSPNTKTSPKNDFMENLSLFKYFLSGISLYFLPVVCNFIIVGAILFLLTFLLTLHPLFSKVMPIFQEIAKSGPGNQMQLLLAMPPQQRVLLDNFSRTVFQMLLLVAGFNFITTLWPTYVTQYGDNIFKAYWHSVRRFLKDPFRFLFIAGLFIASQVFFYVLSAIFGGNILLGALIQLGGLLFNIYAMITLFVYTLRTDNRPLCIQETEGEPEPPDDSDDEASDQDEPPFS